MNDQEKQARRKKRNRSIIEWGIILGVVLLLYVTGWHTQALGTFQRGVLATGIIKPPIPSLDQEFPQASTQLYFADSDNTVRSLAEYRGDVIFLNIWATWCPPCIAEMPSIQSLYDELRDHDNITFLLVSMDEEFELATEFMEKRNFDMPVFHFRNRAQSAYNSGVIPTTYVITKDGKLAMEKRGLAKYDTAEFKQFLRDLAGM